MTPYGSLVRQLRAEKGISLKQMAEGIGFSSSYLSAKELGTRGKPGKELVEKVIQFLQLDECQQAQLRAVVERSNQSVHIPKNAPPAIYLLVHTIIERATELPNKEIMAIECLISSINKIGGCYEK